MVRSKQSGSPLKTPKSMTPKVITPLSKEKTNEKNSKRPLPTASDEEDQELMVNILNGAPSHKKGKFTIPTHVNDDDSESAEDSEGAEDSEEIEDEGGSEVDDSDQEEDEDDNSEDDEDTDDSNELEASESDNEESVPVKTDGITQKNESAQLKVSSPALTPKADREYLLVPGITRNLEALKNTLVEKGFSVDGVHQLKVPLALVTVSTTNDAKKLSSMPKPLSVDGNTIHFLHLEGSKDGLTLLSANNKSNTLFVTGIPKSVTVELLQSKVKGEKPTHVKLLSHGPKNKLYNAAILPFTSTEAADAARDILMKVKFEGRNLFVSYARDIPEQKANQLRGQTKTLLVCDLPPSITEDRLRSLFSDGHEFNLISRNTETICYIKFTSETAAKEAFDTHNNTTLEKSILNLRFVRDREARELKFLLDVTNAPPNTSAPQLTALFPRALDVKQNRYSFTLAFPSAEELKNSVSGVKKIGAAELTLAIYGGLNQNEAYVKNLPYAATEQDVRSLFPGATKVVLEVRDGKPVGAATVTFAAADQCAAALQKRFTLHKRPVFVSLKRVVINQTAKSVPAKPNTDQIRIKSKNQTPPQVGSASEDSSADDEEGSSEGGEDEEHSMESEQIEETKKTKLATEDASDEETDDDSEDADVGSNEGDSADEVDDDDDDDDEGDSSEDEGIDDASDEVPSPKQKKVDHSNKLSRGGDSDNKQRGGFNRGGRGDRGFNRGGGERGFKRGFGGDRGFKRGFGGDQASKRGFGGGDRGFGGGDRGFKRGFGGGDRGFKRGRGGGDRGGFKHRGRGGGNRGQKSY